jgi:SPX domain protein involved in polyphosphate accumulation
MKYGAELHDNVFAPWRLSYIAYDVLKMELKTRQLDHEWNDQDEADFVQVRRATLQRYTDMTIF